MHDKNGKPLHVGDKVRRGDGTEFHIHGFNAEIDHKGAKHAALAEEVELVKKHPQNEGKPEHAGGSIVWGNGPKEPDDTGGGPK